MQSYVRTASFSFPNRMMLFEKENNLFTLITNELFLFLGLVHIRLARPLIQHLYDKTCSCLQFLQQELQPNEN